MKEIKFFEEVCGKMYSYMTRNESSVNKIRIEVINYLYNNGISFEIIDFRVYHRRSYSFFIEDVAFDIYFEHYTYPSMERHTKKTSLYEDVGVLFSEEGKIDSITIDLSATYNLRGSDIIKIIKDVSLINSGKFNIKKIHPQLSKQL